MATAKKVESVEDAWDKEPAPDWVAERTQPSKNRPCNFTLKGKGSSDSWLVIYYDTTEDAIDVLEDPRLDDLMDKIAEKNEEFQLRFKGSASFSKPASKPASGGWNKPAAKSYGKSEPSYDDNFDCEHGERTWVDKGSWRAWMCPADRNDPSKCDPLWANEDGSIQTKKRR